MKKKTVYHLKKGTKIFLLLCVLIGIASYYGYQYYQEYLYTESYEYKLLELGYKQEEMKILIDKLNDEQLEQILTYQYNEFIPEFVKTKYFLYKNLDGYLSQVITQDEDFFKYHGTEGYDYDHLVALVNVKAISEPYENALPVDESKEYALLANKYYELGENYEPNDLVDIELKYYYGDKKQIRSEVYEAFKEMWNAANEEGIYLIIDSAYRSFTHQKKVYQFYEDSKGTKYADSIAARPGFSEHQTGLSLDIYSKECFNAKTFSKSKTYAWLIANSYKYGFILRYPDGKKDITGYSYESWHYRYVGRELAEKVYKEGITYDEYYAFYLE